MITHTNRTYTCVHNCTAEFRGYTIRKRFGAELEERFKRILGNYSEREEASEALLGDGLKPEDVALILDKWFENESKLPQTRDSVHPKLRQADFIQFAQNVSKTGKLWVTFNLLAPLVSALKRFT